MSNIDAAHALLTAINFDRFEEIAARHNPDVVFHSFRGPTLRNSGSVEDWHRTFLRDYADCNYGDVETIEEGEVVAVRATLAAKGYDWREFSQRVVEVLEFEEGGVSARRLYAMLADVELDRPAEAALKTARSFPGGSASETAAAVDGFYGALLGGDTAAASAFLDPKAVMIDGVYGLAAGPDKILALLASMPRPAFGSWRRQRRVAGQRDALVELAIDPARPRAADWVRVVEGRILVIEGYWMLREIGVNTRAGGRARHGKQVILPI